MARELYTQASDPSQRPISTYGTPQHMNVQPQYVPNQQYQQQYIQSQYGQGTNSQQSPTPPPNFYPNPPMAAQGHYPPPGGNNQGAPIFKEGYEQGPGPFQPSARSDPRFGNNASPPLYSQPTDRKIDSSPQPPPQVYAQQQQSPQPQSPYQQQPGYPQIQPQPYPAMQTNVTQPTAIQGMDVRNMRNKPRDANGDREFSNGLCGCFDACGTCCLAWCCPCITYGQNKTRLDHLQRNGYPHPDGGESCGVDCLVHGALMCLGGWGWILQIGQRGSVRERYRIGGNGCTDCLASWCCSPCELTQESIELELEENALLQAGRVHGK